MHVLLEGSPRITAQSPVTLSPTTVQALDPQGPPFFLAACNDQETQFWLDDRQPKSLDAQLASTLERVGAWYAALASQVRRASSAGIAPGNGGGR